MTKAELPSAYTALDRAQTVKVSHYDYERQCWIDTNGRVMPCGHPVRMRPACCYAGSHAGEYVRATAEAEAEAERMHGREDDDDDLSASRSTCPRCQVPAVGCRCAGPGALAWLGGVLAGAREDGRAGRADCAE